MLRRCKGQSKLGLCSSEMYNKTGVTMKLHEKVPNKLNMHVANWIKLYRYTKKRGGFPERVIVKIYEIQRVLKQAKGNVVAVRWHNI